MEIGEEQYQGTATIIEDPTTPGNHCARVIARSEAIADSCDNKVKNSDALASWDCQFFIYANETIPTGQELRLVMRVRADKAGQFESQAHFAPGDYNHYIMFGNIDVTTEWKKVELTTTVTADQTQEGNGKFMQTVAFNLSTNAAGNVFYFDDIKLEVRDPKAPEEFAGWFNLLRKGTLSEDNMGSGFTNFTGRDGKDGRDVQARVVNDPLDGQPALNVTSIGYNYFKRDSVAILDDDSNPVLDPETGLPTYDVTETGYLVKYGEENLTPAMEAVTGAVIKADGFSAEDGEGAISFEMDDQASANNQGVFVIYNNTSESFEGKSIYSRFYFENNGWYYVYNVTFVDDAKYEEFLGVNTPIAKQSSQAMYDLTGRKVTKAVKGLYIKDGKKFIVK